MGGRSSREEKLDNREFIVKLINIQGLTNVKYSELEGEIGRGVVMCVTETQKKVDDIRKSRGIVVRSSMRGEGEQRGGGLMIIYREGEGKNWNKIENGYADILEVEGKIGDLVSRIILCYFRTGAGEEIDRGNRRLRDFILGRIEQVGGEMGMIVLGDFNGHLGYLGEQRENRTGRLVNEMIEGGNLNLLNVDSRCIGR